MYLVYPQKIYENDIKHICQIIEYEIQLNDVHLLGLYRGGLQRYDGDDKEFELIYNANITSNQKIFIIDDIIDEGTTLNKTVEYLHKNFPNNKIEAIVLFESTKNKKIKCDITCYHVSDEWVVFQPFGETVPND